MTPAEAATRVETRRRHALNMTAGVGGWVGGWVWVWVGGWVGVGVGVCVGVRGVCGCAVVCVWVGVGVVCVRACVDECMHI
jgi:hypothetical protein